MKGELERLTPFVDENGILRVGGRLQYAQYAFDKKHPAILPPKHHLSLLLIKHEHVRLLHAGPQLLLSSLRERFWPIRGRSKILPAYICLFICFSTKAIHIELVSDLTTECFLAAFRRFVSRRGKPAQVFSDNGKTFVGAKSELSKLSQFIMSQNQSLSQCLANENIQWNFIPALHRIWGDCGKFA